MKKHHFLSWFLLSCFLSADAFSSSEEKLFDALTCARFEVTLPANPTTGFQWTLQKYDRERFSFEKDIYTPSKPEMPGASGKHTFYFKQKDNTSCPKSTKIQFKHARSWEADSAACVGVIVRFTHQDS